jgi:hypothetical protein
LCSSLSDWPLPLFADILSLKASFIKREITIGQMHLLIN